MDIQHCVAVNSFPSFPPQWVSARHPPCFLWNASTLTRARWPPWWDRLRLPSNISSSRGSPRVQRLEQNCYRNVSYFKINLKHDLSHSIILNKVFSLLVKIWLSNDWILFRLVVSNKPTSLLMQLQKQPNSWKRQLECLFMPKGEDWLKRLTQQVSYTIASAELLNNCPGLYLFHLIVWKWLNVC